MRQQVIVIYNAALEALTKHIDDAFIEVHEKFNTVSGDITPVQKQMLDDLTEKLAGLMTEQVNQNTVIVPEYIQKSGRISRNTIN